MIQVICPGCGRKRKCLEDTLGKRFRCKNCGEVNQVAEPEVSSLPPKVRRRRTQSHSAPPKQQSPKGKPIALLGIAGILALVVIVGAFALTRTSDNKAQPAKEIANDNGQDAVNEVDGTSALAKPVMSESTPSFSLAYPDGTSEVVVRSSLLVLSQDSRHIASAPLENQVDLTPSVIVWSLDDRKLAYDLEVPGGLWPIAVTFLNAGRQLAVVARGESQTRYTVFMWEVASGDLVRQYSADWHRLLVDPKFTPDGATLISYGSPVRAYGSGSVLLLDLPSGQWCGSTNPTAKPVLYGPPGLADLNDRVYDIPVEQIGWLDHEGLRLVTAENGRLALGEMGQAVRIWDLLTAEEITPMNRNAFTGLAEWSSAGDGNHVLTRSESAPTVLRVVNVNTGMVEADLPYEGNPLWYDSETKRLAVATTRPSQITVWDVAGNNSVFEVTLPKYSFGLFTRDRRLLITRGEKIDVWETPEECWRPLDDPPEFGAVDNRLAKQVNSQVRMTPALIAELGQDSLSGQSTDTGEVAFIARRNGANLIAIVDPSTGEKHIIPPNPARTAGHFNHALFLPGGDSIGVTDGKDLFVIDRDQWKEGWVERVRIPDVYRPLGARGSKLLAVEEKLDGDGSFQINGFRTWDLDDLERPPVTIQVTHTQSEWISFAKDRQTSQLISYDVVNGSAISHDGKLMALPYVGEVRLMDTSTGTLVAKLDAGDEFRGRTPVRRLGFSPKGDRLIGGFGIDSAYRPRAIVVWDTKAMTRVAILATETNSVRLDEPIGFTPDGSVALATFVGARPFLFNAETGEQMDTGNLTAWRDGRTRVGLSPGAKAIFLNREAKVGIGYSDYVLYDSRTLIPYGVFRGIAKESSSSVMRNPRIHIAGKLVVVDCGSDRAVYGSWEHFPDGTLGF